MITTNPFAETAVATGNVFGTHPEIKIQRDRSERTKKGYYKNRTAYNTAPIKNSKIYKNMKNK